MKQIKILTKHTKYAKMETLLKSDNTCYLILECEKEDITKQKFSYVYILPENTMTIAFNHSENVYKQCNGIASVGRQNTLSDVIMGFGSGLWVKAVISKTADNYVKSEHEIILGYFAKKSNGLKLDSKQFYFVAHDIPVFEIGKPVDLFGEYPLIEIIDTRI